MRGLVTMLFVSLVATAVPAVVSAQVNPFADEEEEPEEPAQKATDKKKSSKKKKKADEEEAAEEPAKEEADGDADADAEEAADEKGAADTAPAEEAAAEQEEAASSEQAEPVDVAPATPAGRVPLSHNFGKAELITTGVILPLGLGLAIGGPSIFGEPAASMTSPQLDSVDYRLSIASHGDLREGTPFLFGIFDIAGVAYPAALGGFYLLSGLYYWGADTPMLGSQSVNIDHSMIGMAQTVGWTALTAGIVHALVGRQRPYAAFGRDAYGDPAQSGTNLSFFSTTAALSFAMSSFAARDYSDWAMRNGGNVVTGVIAPYAVLYGLSAVIGYSSIYGQQHYFSDVAIAALTGTLIGNLSYVAHFDSHGNPRDKRQGDPEVAPTVLWSPSGKATVGLGLSRSW